MLVALAGAFGASADRIAVQQNHWTALYRSGEEAVFRVCVSTDGGNPIRTGKAKWTLDNFGTTRVASGEIDLAKENPFKLRGKLDGEGFLRLTVSSGTNRVVWGVGYDVARIAQAKARPADFDAYWNGEKARLARDVPLDAKCEPAPWLSTAKRDVFRISFATFGNRRVYGFMTVPKDRSKGPFRTRIRVCDAGPGAVGPWEGHDDEVTVTMNVHMFEPPRELNRQRQMIADLSAALAAKYGLKPGTYYASAGIGRSREDYFFHDSMLGIARAYDWIAAQDFTDDARIVYFGSSQGGGFGLATVYLNPRFSRVCFAVPAITGHYGHLSGRADGWPKLIANQPEGDRAAAEANAAYFDGVNFAAGIRVPVRFIVGFADETCPPPCVYAAYNACPSADKAIVNCVGAGHCGFNAWLAANSDKSTWLDYNAWLGRAPSLPRFETDAAKPFPLLTGRDVGTKYVKPKAGFFGCPSLAASRGGRLWCSFMVGDADGEGDANYDAVVTSGDGGLTWSAPVTVIDAAGPLRALDCGLWTDPAGEVRLFWGQLFSFWDGRGSLCTASLVDAEAAVPQWTASRRLADGYLKNKPSVLSTGEWLLPIEFMPYDRPLWGGMYTMLENDGPHAHPEAGDSSRLMGVWISRDGLASPPEKGGVAATARKDRDYPEHMIVELRDGRLWMLGRTLYGIGESFSADRGRTWSAMTPSRFAAPNSRFYLGRLKSGALLLVKNGATCFGPDGKGCLIPRDIMAAWISDDDGATWTGGLSLDSRKGVSYPDVAETADGFIHCVHDFSRMGAKEIRHHRFTEADVRAGRVVSTGSRLGDLVNAYAVRDSMKESK